MAVTQYRHTGWDGNLNLIVFASLILAGVGIAWLALNDITAGLRYTTILLVGIAFLTLTFFFLSESQRNIVQRLIKNPFTTDYDVAVGMYIIGWFLPLIVTLVTSLFAFNFSVSQLMIPLAGTQINTQILQSFEVAQTEFNPFWQWFIAVFTAGTVEEFVFGFVLMLVGVVLGMLVWIMLFGNKNLNADSAKNFYLIFGLLFSAGLFGGAHLLNGTYMGIMFLIAIGFRLIMNYGLYSLGIFLTFTIGYHQSNNAIWFWNAYGPTTTIQALNSAGGIFVLALFGLILFYGIRRIEPITKKLGQVFSSAF